MSDAAPPPWVRRLPKMVSQESIHLAHAELERRRALLFWGHGEGAVALAGQMALSQAYERIARLESMLESLSPGSPTSGPSA